MARADGSDVLALAVVPNAAGVGLQVSDVTQTGSRSHGPARLLRGQLRRPHGDRHRASLRRRLLPREPGAAGPPGLRLGARRPRRAQTRPGTSPLPAAWPAKDASAIVARATRTWKGLKSLRYRERLSSDPTHAVTSSWQIVAPDRLAYQIRGEGQAVIVGEQALGQAAGRRLGRDRARSACTSPMPFWVAATDAHVVDSATISGRAVWRVSFFDPRTPGWFLAASTRRPTARSTST